MVLLITSVLNPRKMLKVHSGTIWSAVEKPTRLYSRGVHQIPVHMHSKITRRRHGFNLRLVSMETRILASYAGTVFVLCPSLFISSNTVFPAKGPKRTPSGFHVLIRLSRVVHEKSDSISHQENHYRSTSSVLPSNLTI